MTHLYFPGVSAKWVIGFFGLFHTSVASLAIGVAFVVTIAQIIGYRSRNIRFDLFAKRAQLFHVCIYNIGTVNAIGLVFVLSGLYPQFWTQLFSHFFWPLIIEEVTFFLLATTLTFHYFFWDQMWGHKKLHIFLGAMLIPLFVLQFYIIVAVGSFMLTPGFAEGEASLAGGILGYDLRAFYNPSFLMLQFHRMMANVAYGGFILAAWCGVRLYMSKTEEQRSYYEDCGKLAFYISFTFFLSLPIIGYFYSHAIMRTASEAFWNLMIGRGDILILGIDSWWVKQLFVAAMLGISIAYFRRVDKKDEPFTLPSMFVWAIAFFYLMFYIAMGQIMTWAFFWWSLIFALGSLFLGVLLLRKGSPRSVFVIMGVISFLTIMLGGYVREAARPRFVDRVAHYDSVYQPRFQSRYLMVDVDEATAEKLMAPPEKNVDSTASMIRVKCAECHSLDLVIDYEKDDWEEVVTLMLAYGMEASDEEAKAMIEYLTEGKPIQESVRNE